MEGDRTSGPRGVPASQPVPPPPGAQTTPGGTVGYARAPASPNRRALAWVLGTFAALGAVLLGALTLLVIGLETGVTAFVTGLVAAMLPLPLYLAVVLWIDRFEREPAWMLATAFVWGATGAVFGALLVNSIVGLVLGDLVTAVVSAPVVEESGKGLALLVLYLWQRDEFDGVVDSIVYAGMVGLGFAATENILYYGRSALEGSLVLGVVFVLRGVIAPFSHPLFAAMTGIGLGLARQSDRPVPRFVWPAVGLLAAMGLHALWNLSATVFGLVGFVAAYLFVMVPTFCGAVAAVFLGLARERTILRRHLLPEVQRGLLPPDEYERLCRVRGRIAAAWRALRAGGPGRWRARMRYHQAASELAFHRARVARGLARDPHAAAQREADHLQRLHTLSRELTRG